MGSLSRSKDYNNQPWEHEAMVLEGEMYMDFLSELFVNGEPDIQQYILSI
jgi:hypothetical protein